MPVAAATPAASGMKRWLREPLLHFLLAGTLFFAAYGWLNRESATASRTIHISAAEVDWLKKTWARQWMRPPTEEELRGLVTGYIKEALLAREALEMGLGENDTIIRRRLAQKMEFLVQDTASLAEPGDAELRRFYSLHQTRYLEPPRVSFTHIFYRKEADAQKGLVRLATQSPDMLGDPSTLERDHTGADAQAVTNQFGEAFSRQVFSLATGLWVGPVASGYGFHLVRISARQSARPTPYEAASAQVREDWQREEQAKAGERLFADLLRKYDVKIDESVKPLAGSLAEKAR